MGVFHGANTAGYIDFSANKKVFFLSFFLSVVSLYHMSCCAGRLSQIRKFKGAFHLLPVCYIAHPI